MTFAFVSGSQYVQCRCASLCDGDVSGFCSFLERDCLENMVGAKVLIEVMVEVVEGETVEVVQLNLDVLLQEVVVLVWWR